MKRCFFFFLLQTLLWNPTAYAFDVSVDNEEFCIDNLPNTLIFTITHQSNETFQTVSGLDQLGILTNVITSSPTVTYLVVAIDDDNITIDKHEVVVTMLDNTTSVTSNETQIVDVFGLIQRTINFNPITDLIYNCDYVSINFTTDGDTLTNELVLVYVNDRFYKEQQLTIDGTQGTLTDMRIERPLEDSLRFDIYLESSRDNQCLNRQKVNEGDLGAVAPIARAVIDDNYVVASQTYGQLTFSSNSINSAEQLWEVYEDGNLIGSSFSYYNADFIFNFATPNLKKGESTPYKEYDVVLIASDASGAINCQSGINRDTLRNVEVPYFPRVKLPTAVSKRSSANEDGSYRLLIRDRVSIDNFNIKIFNATNLLVFESNDPNFIFGDDESLSSSLYNAKIKLEYDDGLVENLNTSFIVTP